MCCLLKIPSLPILYSVKVILTCITIVSHSGLFKSGYKTRKPWLSEGLKKSIERKISYIILNKRLKSQSMKSFIKSTVTKWINLCRLLNENIMSIACRKISIIWRLPGISWRKYLIKIWIICHARGFISITRCVMIIKRIAESFNSFFVNVGPNLAKNIPSDSRSPTGYMESNPCSTAVIPASQNEIITIIKNLKQSSPGWNDISSFIVKHTCHYFIERLMHVANLSITQGVFPHQLKVAKVIPLFKSNDPMVFSNYRPVSILPLFSKIFGHLMYNCLLTNANYYMSFHSGSAVFIHLNWRSRVLWIKYRMPWRMASISLDFSSTSLRHLTSKSRHFVRKIRVSRHPWYSTDVVYKPSFR